MNREIRAEFIGKILGTRAVRRRSGAAQEVTPPSGA